MKFFKKIPLWLFTGTLYGLSWPIFDNINLSFLAWFAFVPLFLFLEKNKNNFKKSILGSYATLFIFGCFSAGWLFNFPQGTLKVAVIFILEQFWAFFPFLLFYFFQKKIHFDKAIWFFPFIWMIWEWMYLGLEFTMGTHISAYSQSNNIWLIQYVDITGIWGVSFWIMLFNVLIFKAFKESKEQLLQPTFFKKIGFITLLMVGIPLIYGFYAFSKYDTVFGKKINLTVIPTQFSPETLLNTSNIFSIVDKTLYISDSMAFSNENRNFHSDLYIWTETGLTLTLDESNLKSTLYDAVKDWKAALITGGKNETDSIIVRRYVSGVLLSHKDTTPKFHYKTRLTPGQEAIPYHSLLLKIPNFPIKQSDGRFFDKGMISKPLKLITKNNQDFLVGISLCYEQWFPKHWAALSRNGAEFYTQLAAEGWYGNVGFMTFMANVTKIRSIENRKQTARAANTGISCFIDQFGRTQKNKFQKYSPIQKSLTALSNITFYAKYPNLFPICGFVILLTLILTQFINIKNN